MLPKPEKIKKSSSDSDSEVKEISPADKTAQKRRLLILLIGLTIGLSTIFSIYNYFKNYHFALPTFSAPQVNLSSVPLESSLKSLLKSDYPNYSFTVQTNSIDPYFWSTNPQSTPQDFPTLSSTIEKYHQPLDEKIVSSLPQGLKIFQYSTNNRYQYIIITPENQIYIDIAGNPNSVISELLPLIYWSLVKQ